MPAALQAVLEQLPATSHPMDVLRTGCSVLGTLEPEKASHTVDGARNIADRLIRNGWDVGRVRKLMQTIGFGGIATALFIVGEVETWWLAIGIMTIGNALGAFVVGGFFLRLGLAAEHGLGEKAAVREFGDVAFVDQELQVGRHAALDLVGGFGPGEREHQFLLFLQQRGIQIQEKINQ